MLRILNREMSTKSYNAQTVNSRVSCSCQVNCPRMFSAKTTGIVPFRIRLSADKICSDYVDLFIFN